MSEGEDRWRIGQLSVRLGVSPEVLRAWEQRYSLLRPERSPGGFRLYTSADEARVRRVLKHKKRGLATAEAARLALDEDEIGKPHMASAPEGSRAMGRGVGEDLRKRLAAGLEAYDEAATQAAIDRVFAIAGVDLAIQAVVLPALRDIGERWEHGRADVADEHYATNLLQGRLIGLARGWDEGQGPRAVLACAPGELHVVGLICLGLALRERGWRIVFLGADTPIAAVERTTGEVAPSLVALSAIVPERFLVHEAEIQALSTQTTLGIGGAGATPQVAARVGALAPQPDPISAAKHWGRTAYLERQRP